MNISDLVLFANEKKEKIEALKNYMRKGIPIISYGKGEFAGHIKGELKKYDILVTDSFTDREYKVCEEDLTLEECKEKYSSFVLLICISDENIITEKKKDFAEESCILETVFLGQNYPSDTPFMSPEYLLDNQEQLETVYHWLEDDLSREVMSAFIKAKLSGNSEYLSDVAVKSGREYFNEIFNDFHNEIMIDGGAYIGDTYIDALDAGFPFLKYYAFEPDGENYKVLRENTKNDDRIIAVNKGLYSSSKWISFVEKGTDASRLQENGLGGGTSVEVTSIDEAANDATFIKLDIEGAELEALKGAEKTILKNGPKLAVCAYHRLEDIISIPYWMKSINPEYRIYFRKHHKNTTRDLLIYAYLEK